ncbi:MAG: thymidylate kinase, partial [Planctomycetota bacterium]|nr:thymidylate kinase [Planctomycetota bacterium]
GVDRRAVEQLTAVATGRLRPDRYLVLWVPASVGLERRADRAPDRMEAKGRAFVRAVAAAYRREAQRAPRRYRLVDGRGSVAEVRARMWRAVEPLVR